MDRQQRRDLKHDKFVDEIGSLSTRARENQRLLFTITGVAVVVAVLVYGIYFYRSNHEEKAQLALGKAMDTIESPLLPAPGAPPQPGAKYKTEAARPAEAAKPESSLPPDAILALLAHAWDAQGNATKTKETYRRIVTEFPDSPYALEAQRRMGPA